MPEVFVASNVLIVSSIVAKKLQPLRGIELKPVVFEEAFSLEYDLEHEMPERVARANPDKWWDRCRRIGKPMKPPEETYYECVVWTVWDFLNRDGPKITIVDPCSGEERKTLDARSLLQKYDICYIDYGYVLTEEALAALSPHLLEPYFRWNALPDLDDATPAENAV